MKQIRLVLAWLLIAAMLIPGVTMAEDIEDAIEPGSAVEEITEDEAVLPEIIADEPVTGEPVEETDIGDMIPVGTGVLDILTEEFGMPAEKICWLP